MQFSLDPWGNTLATGTEDGRLLVFDTQTFEQLYEDKVSQHCVNSVSFHPYAAMLIATSGQRNFDLPPDDIEERGDAWTSGSSSSSCSFNSNNNVLSANHYKNNETTHLTGNNQSSVSSAIEQQGEEKWSELQVYGLHKNDVLLKQLYEAYATNIDATS